MVGKKSRRISKVQRLILWERVEGGGGIYDAREVGGQGQLGACGE